MSQVDCSVPRIAARRTDNHVTITLACLAIAALAITTRATAEPTMQYQWLLDDAPAWAMSGEWAYGVPLGLGGEQFGNADPASGYTGENVCGVNLYGDYSTEIGGPYYLTIGPIDLTGVSGSSLHFWRWLNVDWLPWVSAKVEVSNDDANWVTLWENAHVEIADDAWNHWELDSAPVTDGQPTVWIRWSYEVLTGGTWAYSGWNIDDVEIWGVAAASPGDANCDGLVNYGDIDPFVMALTSPAAYAAAYPDCDINSADVNGDSLVNNGDIDAFVALLGN